MSARTSIAIGLAWTAVTLGAARPAAAQGRTTAELALLLATIRDDNIFWRPVPVSDQVWRISPHLRITRDTARSNWFTTVATDAEWYGLHREFSTPIARQQAMTRLFLQTGSDSALAITGRSDTSINPAEINTGTGLHLGRLRAWRWTAAPEYTHRVLSRTMLVGGYELRIERGAIVPMIVTHAGLFRLEHDLGDRDVLRTQYLAEVFRFEDAGSILSHRATVGWASRVTPFSRIAIDGGVRVTDGLVRPEVEVSAARTFQDFDAMASYAWTQTTALGVERPIEVHRVTGDLRFTSARGFGIALQGGLYNNATEPGRTTVYRSGLSVFQRLFGPVSLSASFGIDYQSAPLRLGRFGDPAIEVVGGKPPRPSGLQAFFAPRLATHEHVRRRAFAIQLVFAGPRWSRDDAERRRDAERTGVRPGTGGREGGQ